MKEKKVMLLIGFMFIESIALVFVTFLLSTGHYSTGSLLSLYYSQPLLVLLNTIPVFLTALLAFFLFRRVDLSIILTSIIFFTMSVLNYWKLCSRSEPLYASDVFLINEAAGIAKQYIFIDRKIMGAFILTVIICLFGIIVQNRSKKIEIKKRYIHFAILFATVFVLYHTVHTSRNVFTFFKSWQGLDYWYEKTQYISNGTIYSVVYSTKEFFEKPDFEYNEVEASLILENYENDPIPANKRANLIFIMLEAFSDLTQYTDIDFTNDPYIQYHELQNDSYSGKLFTNTFAGGTAITERNVLTGFMEYDRFLKNSWSYARYFGENDYYLNGSHPGGEGYYSRNVVFDHLGFEDFYFFENYYNKYTNNPWIITDDTLFPEIASFCKKGNEEGQYVFSYNITIQNHGPYSDSEVKFDTEYLSQNGFSSKENYYIVNNYLQGLEKTGNALEQLFNSLKTLNTPTVVVVFGDHKPWLGNNNEGYDDLGIGINIQSEDTLLNYYCTEYLIWGNEKAKNVFGDVFNGQGPMISAHYLMNTVFDILDWEGPSFLKLSNELEEILPIASYRDIYSEGGELKTYSELSEESKSKLIEFRKVERYLKKDLY